jgi:hypothetical protein
MLQQKLDEMESRSTQQAEEAKEIEERLERSRVAHGNGQALLWRGLSAPGRKACTIDNIRVAPASVDQQMFLHL